MKMTAKKTTVCLSIAALVGISVVGCRQAAQRMASIAPDVPMLQQKRAHTVETRLSIARVQEKQGNLRAARQIYQELQEDVPENAVAPHRLGVIASRNGDHESAQKHFTRALKLDRHNVEVLADWGYSLYLQGKLKDAEAVLRQALEESPGDVRATNNLAMVLGQAGEFDRAFTLFRQANGEAAAWLNLGYVHTNLANSKKATECFSRALSHDHELEPAAHALVQIAELKQRAGRRAQHKKRIANAAGKTESGSTDAETAGSVAGTENGEEPTRTRTKSVARAEEAEGSDGADSAEAKSNIVQAVHLDEVDSDAAQNAGPEGK